ncbi:ATP-binding protein, partial [Flavihumibacter cheonanensis]|uniref:ATP-binding protein n=1 Tax=Flavihumibacter cheonanensis TaxID=1442385 RepID=UPI0034DB6B8D
MTGPHPAVAHVRRAVRTALADLETGSVVLVAVSGGADSMALAAATAFEARDAPWRCAGVVVDHQLQPGSAEVAARVAG